MLVLVNSALTITGANGVISTDALLQKQPENSELPILIELEPVPVREFNNMFAALYDVLLHATKLKEVH
jgi:hypothetical protein